MPVQPKYNHNCKECEFVGSVWYHDITADVYKHSYAIVVRISNNPNDTYTMIARDMELVENNTRTYYTPIRLSNTSGINKVNMILYNPQDTANKRLGWDITHILGRAAVLVEGGE